MAIDLSKQYKLINLLAQRERVICDLYSIFAKIDQKDRAFWQSLSDDESQHANLLIDLISDISTGSISLEDSKINIKEIKSGIMHVKALEALSLDQKISPSRALKEAYSIENSLLESRIFEELSFLAPTMAEVFIVLNNSTQRHAQRITKQMSIAY